MSGEQMTPELILAVGQALYGRKWQSELADALAVNRGTLRRWISGEREPKRWVWEDLSELVEDRVRLLVELRQAVAARVRTALP